MPQDYSAEAIIKEKEALYGERATWETHWQDIATYVLPDVEVTDHRTPGSKTNTHLFDNTGIHSNELLANGLHGTLINPSTYWFELTTGDEELDGDDDVREYFHDTEMKMHAALNNSNFNTEVPPMFKHLTGFGTSVMQMEEDEELLFRFRTLPLKECFIKENHKGFVDQLLRCWKWDANKIVREFGEENVGKDVLKAYNKNDKKLFEIIHYVYPMPKPKGPLTFGSKYVLVDEKLILRDKGFREFPFMVPRWTKEAGEDYGRSPGMIALPEIKTLNKITEQMIIAAQKSIDPPMQLPDDGFILPVKLQAGKVNYYRAGSNDRAEQMIKDIRLDYGYQEMDSRRLRIRQAFYVDQLQMTEKTGNPRTAEEIMRKAEENMRLFGPVLGRLNYEFLRPLIDRVYSIMQRRGLLMQVPQVLLENLAGGVFGVRYSSLIAKAQRVNESQSVSRFLQMSAPIVQLQPDSGDVIDGEEYIKLQARTFSLPPKLIRKKSQIQALREARAQAQQQVVDNENQQAQADVENKQAQSVGQLLQMQKR